MTKPESQKSKDARAASFAEFLQSDVPPDQAAEFAQWWEDYEQAISDVEALRRRLENTEGTATVGVAGADEKTDRINEIRAQIEAMQGLYGGEIIGYRREAKAAETPHGQAAVTAEHVTDVGAKEPRQTGPKRRVDLMQKIVDEAVKVCGNDDGKVFCQLREWAGEKPPRQPLIGVTEEGIQWVDSNDKPCFLNRGALKKRLNRRR